MSSSSYQSFMEIVFLNKKKILFCSTLFRRILFHNISLFVWIYFTLNELYYFKVIVNVVQNSGTFK